MPLSTVARELPLARVHGEFVAGLRFEDLGPAEIDVAKLLVIDAVASGLAARGGELDATLTRMLASEPGGPCTVIGHPAIRGLHPRTATWVNGALIHALDFDDIPHFGAVELPSAMSVIQQQPRTGRDLLTAFVAGFEVGARVTAALAHGRVQHPIGLGGAIVSASVVGSLLGYDRETVTTALGIAASHAMGLSQNFGTLTKPLHAGRASESGLLSAQLAASGWTADPMIFEGPKGFLQGYGDPDSAMDGYDGDFWISRMPADLSGGSRLDPATWPSEWRSTAPDVSLVALGAPPDQRRGGPNLKRGPSFKPWPACGGNNAALTAAFTLFLDPSVDRDLIDRVIVTVPFDPARSAVFRVQPVSGLEGKFSLGYGVAAAWLDGAVTVESYTDEGFERLRRSGRLDRVTVETDPAYIERAPQRPGDPDCNWCAVTIRFTDGRERTAWAFNRGVELSETAVISKYRLYAERVLGKEASEVSLDSLLNLDEVADCAPLVRSWSTSGESDPHY